MNNNKLKEYYQQKLTKLGYDLYKVITYLPFRLDTISPNLHTKADLYFVTGRITKEEQKAKFTTISVMTKTGIVNFFDFGKKITYLKDKNINYQFLLKTSNDYLSLVEVSILGKTQSDYFALGNLKEKIYYRAIYNSLSYQIRSKQINLFHQELIDNTYLLNLKGLVPDSMLGSHILDLKPLHKPTNIEEYNKTLRDWNNFQSFLHLCFLNNLDQNKTIEQALATQYPEEMLERFESRIGYNLSISQRQAIDQILKNITYLPNTPIPS